MQEIPTITNGILQTKEPQNHNIDTIKLMTNRLFALVPLVTLSVPTPNVAKTEPKIAIAFYMQQVDNTVSIGKPALNPSDRMLQRCAEIIQMAKNDWETLYSINA